MPIPEMKRLEPFGIALESQKTVLTHEEGTMVAAGECNPQTAGQPSSDLLHFALPTPENLLCLLTGC